MKIYYNQFWSTHHGKVSIITPVYNRRQELPRTLKSVESQTYDNLEHIIIDDGSKESVDDIMAAYMERVTYPVAFIKKENGGVHTARNAGTKLSRGSLLYFLDSDDELVLEGIDILVKGWDLIPSEKQKEYRECNAFCMNQDGKRIGGHLPADINNRKYSEALSIAQEAKHGEKTAIYRADIMRDNLWPEPEGVKFVTEGINWLKLGFQYKTWFIDDVVRIYHMETETSLCNAGRTRSNQKLTDMLYNGLWYINNGRKYGQSMKTTLRFLVQHCVLWHVLHWRRAYPNFAWTKKGINSSVNNMLFVLLWLPSIVLALIYVKKHS